MLVHFSPPYFATSRATKCCVLLRNYVHLVRANCYSQRKDIIVCKLDFHWCIQSQDSFIFSHSQKSSHKSLSWQDLVLGSSYCMPCPNKYSCLHKMTNYHTDQTSLSWQKWITERSFPSLLSMSRGFLDTLTLSMQPLNPK